MNAEVIRAADRWIKILAVLAGFTLALAGITVTLVGYIGVRAIDRLDQISNTITEVAPVVRINSSDISDLKKSDTEINVRINTNIQEIYKLKGANNGL